MTKAERLAKALDSMMQVAALLRSQAAELEALRADAERYRWLRDNEVTIDRTRRRGEAHMHVEVIGATRWARRATLDAAIDAARQS